MVPLKTFAGVCVGMESSLYPQWWPQLTLPTFKVTESRCLKRICIGEELSLVRVKVPWPVSSREAVFRYFALEYFEEEIVLVLLKSVSDLQEIDESIHGFSNEDIPSAEGTVRMDLMGGFALQKVDSTQTYFRLFLQQAVVMKTFGRLLRLDLSIGAYEKDYSPLMN